MEVPTLFFAFLLWNFVNIHFSLALARITLKTIKETNSYKF